MLEDSFKTRMPFSQALWTWFAITFKTTLFLLYFDTLKIHSYFLKTALIVIGHSASHQLMTSSKNLVASAQFVVALATSEL